MNITSLNNTNISISDTSSMNAIDISVLKKSLDSVEVSGDMLTRMMEQSVNPNIGANIDIKMYINFLLLLAKFKLLLLI